MSQAHLLVRERMNTTRVAPRSPRNHVFRNGNFTLALAGWCWQLWARSGCGGPGWAPGWCGWAVSSLLRRCCGGAFCWRPAISLPTQSVDVGEVG